jgi:phospholipid/cholesterol/gamma-HCH transport system substrate-binding protein
MSSRWLPLQLAGFGLIGILGILYVAFGVIGVHGVNRPYHVAVELSEAGGIFPHANVDYRGQQVGTVSSVRLQGDGVIVDLAIDSGVQVPDDASATVTSLSAVGEQYVDLRPSRSGPPYFSDGSVIPRSRAHTPLPVATWLVDVEGLVNSVNPSDISTTVDETGAAFAGVGPQMRDLIANGKSLLDSLQSVAPQTVDLEQSTQVNLHTAAQSTDDFRRFSASLAQLTDQLKASNNDVRSLIDNGNFLVPEFDTFLRDNGPALTVLLGNSATYGNISVARVPALEQLLLVLPDFGNKMAGVVKGGVIQSRGYIDDTNTVCAYILPSLMRSPLDGTPRSPFMNLDCAATAADMLQRGARYAPRPGGSGAQAAAAGATGPGGATASGASGAAATYDPTTGLLTAPDGRLVRLGWDGGQKAAWGDASWLSLLVASVGN